MVGPQYHAPKAPNTQRYTQLPLPQKTVSTAQSSNAGKAQQFVFGKTLENDWWRIFHSPALNYWVSQGIDNNQTLAAAKAALREANDTLYAQMGGLLLPSVDFNGGVARTQLNGVTFGTASSATTFNVINAGFQASYLLDIWGSSRRQVEAYAAQADYQRYEMIGTYVTLTTDIATTVISIASLQDQIKSTQRLINAQKTVLAITQKQFLSGGVSKTAVLTQKTLLEQTQATLPPLQKSLSNEHHALAVLVGKPTSLMLPVRLSLNKIRLPAQLPVSFPSDVIKQRPDIQASAALLHVASAQVGVATANLLPQVTLNANFGWQATSTVNFFNSANQVWSLGAGLLQPIFHGGQLIFQRKAAIESLNQARAQYEQTVLQAFKNIADALRAIQFDADEFKDQRIAENTALKTLIITEKQFRVGGQNYLSVLNAQEQYQKIVLSRITAQSARYIDTAVLYQTLGGGWWNNKF